jgi:hypothetical protein
MLRRMWQLVAAFSLTGPKGLARLQTLFSGLKAAAPSAEKER